MKVDATKPGACWYVTGPCGRQLIDFLQALESVGVLRQILIWEKNNTTFGRSDYHYQHETVFYGWSPGAAHRKPSIIGQSSLLKFDRIQSNDLHPTMKPISLIEYCIEQSSDPGAVVLDPFAGSGSTLVACDNTGRKSVNIEIDPAWCDVIVKRYDSLDPNYAAFKL